MSKGALVLMVGLLTTISYKYVPIIYHDYKGLIALITTSYQIAMPHQYNPIC